MLQNNAIRTCLTHPPLPNNAVPPNQPPNHVYISVMHEFEHDHQFTFLRVTNTYVCIIIIHIIQSLSCTLIHSAITIVSFCWPTLQNLSMAVHFQTKL